MSKNQPLPAPDYFIVPPPAHFRVRPDFIEEMCVGDALMRHLPRDDNSYRHWLRMTGNPPERFPLESLRRHVGTPYQMTARYLLRQAVLPGDATVVNLVTDQRRWAGVVDFRGLFDFVLHRAVQRAVYGGHQEAIARGFLFPRAQRNDGGTPHFARWAIGYAAGTGFCTILDRTWDQAEAHYLDGKPSAGASAVFENIPIF